MKNKTTLACVLSLCMFLIAHSAFSLPLQAYRDLPDSELPIRETVDWEDDRPAPDLSLLPNVPGARQLESRFLEYRPEVTVQKIYRISLGEEMAQEKLFAAIINILGRPESQVGYTYHSATRDEDVVLFEESYISNKKGKKAEGFSVEPDNLPNSLSYYQFVDEANFSGTVLRQRIEKGEGYLSFRSENTERMWYAIIPVLKAGGVINDMLIFPDGDTLYVYSTTQVEKVPAAKKIGLPLHLPSMFGKRMDVMAQWMEEQLKAELR